MFSSGSNVRSHHAVPKRLRALHYDESRYAKGNRYTNVVCWITVGLSKFGNATSDLFRVVQRISNLRSFSSHSRSMFQKLYVLGKI